MSDKEEIESTISRFVTAYNAGQTAEVLACYAEDLIKFRNGALSETKAEVGQRLSAVFEEFHSRVQGVTDEIQTSGDMAYSRGSVRVVLTPKAGVGQTKVIGKWN